MICFFSLQKHHYHELDETIQGILGNIPHNFTNYWINKFPRLLSHSYHALELCSNEPSFRHYYPKMYMFSKPEYFYAEDPPKDEEAEINWRRFIMKGNAGGGGGDQVPQTDPVNWRQLTNASPQQASPAKKNKKGAYNFRRINDPSDPVAGIENSPTNVNNGIKAKRKFYPRKDPKSKDQWGDGGPAN